MGMDDLPTRKQRIARLLSQENNVIYVQAPLTLLGAFKKRSRLQGYVVREEQSLCILQTPVILPFGLKVSFLHCLNSIIFRSFIKKALSKRGFNPDILWFYLPDFPSLAMDYPNAVKVYDCVDDHSAYPGLRDPSFVRTLEKKLSKKMDLIFATTRELAFRLSQYGLQVHCVPNGVDWELFGSNDIIEWDRMVSIPHPRIGYLGAIHQWFDLALIEKLLEGIPEAHFILAGPSQRPDLDKLSNHPRLHMAGRVEVQQAPSCIQAFDVCLIPFIPNELTLNISPLKFFEYCALGKPTVTLPINQLKDFHELCYFYEDAESCILEIRKALQEAPALVDSRRKLAKMHSWDTIIEHIFQLVFEKLPKS